MARQLLEDIHKLNILRDNAASSGNKTVYNPHSSNSENEYKIKVRSKPPCLKYTLSFINQLVWKLKVSKDKS